jgi:hypothetical protein
MEHALHLLENVFVLQDGKEMIVKQCIALLVTQEEEIVQLEHVFVILTGLDFFVTFQLNHVLVTDSVVLINLNQEDIVIISQVHVIATLVGREQLVVKNHVL